MAYTYIPFSEAKRTPAVIVDSYHPNGLVLSHWRGAPTPEALREDTSGGTVLQALKQNWSDLAMYRYTTANHFDIDGFVGIWALLNPELALQHEELLRQMAIIGDFRELDIEAPFAKEALQLVCWINAEEKTRFYPPFGADQLEENEIVASVPKFEFFLPAFTAVLQNPIEYEAIWRPEFEEVMKGVQQMQGEETQVERYSELGLIVVKTSEPLHYYALFGPTAGYDIVLTSYAGQRYELECKYTTWIELASRPTLPRPDLRPLAKHLDALEKSDFQWTADGPTDTGPLLQLLPRRLRKAERYANPIDRPIYSSSLSPSEFTSEVVSYLEKSFKDVQPKRHWSWEEVKRRSY